MALMTHVGPERLNPLHPIATLSVSVVAFAGIAKKLVPDVMHPVLPTGPKSVDTVKMKPVDVP